jgi:hypothetical protein
MQPPKTGTVCFLPNHKDILIPAAMLQLLLHFKLSGPSTYFFTKNIHFGATSKPVKEYYYKTVKHIIIKPAAGDLIPQGITKFV